jgi:hypothetical protein
VTQEASINDFGLLIAYVLPGFTSLWGATHLTDALQPWFGQLPDTVPTVGGFLYMTVAAIAAGITVSTVRWLVVDPIHHHTGIQPPAWDFSLLKESTPAFTIIVDHYYRYYQSSANLLVSITFVYLARRWALGFLSAPVGMADLGFLVLAIILFLGSRDSLHRYYTRGGQLLQRHARPSPRTGTAAK